MMWKFLKQDVLFPKSLNWVQHGVSRFGLLTVDNLTFYLHKSEIIFSSNKTDIAIL